MDIKSALMGIAFVIMWSSAFTSAKIIVETAPPMWALAVRFLISGGIAVGIAALLGQSARLTRGQWRNTVIFGVCQNALYLGLFFVAMQWIEAGLASIIASSMPLVVAFLSWSLLKEKIPPIAVLGLIAGFAGVALIMSARLTTGADPIGLMICAVGVLALAIATLSVRGAASGGNVLMIVGLQMLVGSAVLFIPAILFEVPEVELSTNLVLAFVYTTIVPGLAATWVWFKLVGRIGSTNAATYHFLNPFFGVAIAAVIIGEELSVRDFIGVAIITFGILAVQLSRRTAKKTAPTRG